MSSNGPRKLPGFDWDPKKNRYFPTSSRQRKPQQQTEDSTDVVVSTPTPIKVSWKSTPVYEVNCPSSFYARGFYFDDLNSKLTLFNKAFPGFEVYDCDIRPVDHALKNHFKLKLRHVGTHFVPTGQSRITNYLDGRPNNNTIVLASHENLFRIKYNNADSSFWVQRTMHEKNIRTIDRRNNEVYFWRSNRVVMLDLEDESLQEKSFSTEESVLAVKGFDTAVLFSDRNGRMLKYDKRGKKCHQLFKHSYVAINNFQLLENEFVLLYSTTVDSVFGHDIRFINGNPLFTLPHFSDLSWSSNVSHFTELVTSSLEPSCFYATRNNGKVFAKYDLLNGNLPIERVNRQVLFSASTESIVFLFTEP